MWFGPGPVAAPLTVMVKEPSALRMSLLPLRTDAVVPDNSPKARRSAISAGISLATYVGTGLAMWRFNHAQNEFDDLKVGGMTDYTTLQSVEQRGRRWSYVANAGIAASIAMTVLTVYVTW